MKDESPRDQADDWQDLIEILATAVLLDWRAQKRGEESSVSRLSSPDEPCSVFRAVNNSETPENGRT